MMDPLLFARIATFVVFGAAIVLTIVAALRYHRNKRGADGRRRVVFLVVSLVFLVTTLAFQNVLVHAVNRGMIVEYVTTQDLETDLELGLPDVAPGTENGWNVVLLEIMDGGVRKDYHALNPWQLTEPVDYTLYESRLLRAARPDYDDAIPLVYGATSTGYRTPVNHFADIPAFAPGTVILAWTWSLTSPDARFLGVPVQRILSFAVIEGYDATKPLAEQDEAVTVEIDRLFAMI